MKKGRFSKEEMNFTIDLKEYGAEHGVDVREVDDLEEALHIFSGRQLEREEKELEVNEDYLEIMKSLAIELCNRSSVLQNQVAASQGHKSQK